MSISYLDFELEIGAGDGRTYPIAVLQSPAGNVRSRFDFSLGALELENRLLSLQNALLRSGGDRRKTPTRDEQIIRTFGLELFTTLFQDDVRSLFYESKRMAAAQGSYLRVKLRILDPQMAALPWEFLFDARQNEYLSLAHSTPLIRYLEVAQPPHPLRIEPPLRILVNLGINSWTDSYRHLTTNSSYLSVQGFTPNCTRHDRQPHRLRTP